MRVSFSDYSQTPNKALEDIFKEKVLEILSKDVDKKIKLNNFILWDKSMGNRYTKKHKVIISIMSSGKIFVFRERIKLLECQGLALLDSETDEHRHMVPEYLKIILKEIENGNYSLVDDYK